MEIYTAIAMTQGVIQRIASYKLREDAEQIVLEWAKDSEMNVDNFDELMRMQEEGYRENEFFVQANPFKSFEPLYCYKHTRMSSYDLQAKLAEDGYPFAEECNGSEFEEYIRCRQNQDAFYFDDLLPIPKRIEDLLDMHPNVGTLKGYLKRKTSEFSQSTLQILYNQNADLIPVDPTSTGHIFTLETLENISCPEFYDEEDMPCKEVLTELKMIIAGLKNCTADMLYLTSN